MKRPAPDAWKSVNGPAALAAMMGGSPRLQPFTLATNRGTINTAAGVSTVTLEAQVPADMDFYALAASLAVWSPVNDTEGFTAQPHLSPPYWWAHADISEDRGGRRLSNIPVSVGSIFGKADRPFIYPVPWFLQAGTRVRVKIDNASELDDANEQVIACWHGFKKPANLPPLPYPPLCEPRMLDILSRYYPDGDISRAEPFFYSLFTGHDQLASTAAFVPMATESPTFTVSGHDFALCYQMAEFYDDGTAAYLDGAALGLPDHTAHLVLDEGKVRLMDRPVGLHTVFGHGRRFFKWPEPLVITDGHSLTAIVSPGKLPNTAENRFLGHLTFAGVKLRRGAV